MRVNAVPVFRNNNVFKSYQTDNSGNRAGKYRKYLEKRSYIDRELEAFDNLSVAALFGALIAGVISIDLSKKLKGTEKASIGLMALAVILTGAGWIKKYQLSKQYDKDNNG